MKKNGKNAAYFAQAGTSKIQVIKTASASGNQARKRRSWKEVIQRALACLVIATHKPQASARQPRKRYSVKGILGRALACVMVMAIADVALINFMFFPECNRITHDCFLVQHLWGAK